MMITIAGIFTSKSKIGFQFLHEVIFKKQIGPNIVRVYSLYII